MYSSLYVECDWEDQDPHFQTAIDHHYPVFPYTFANQDGEATLYLVQNCETKEEPIEKKEAKPEWQPSVPMHIIFPINKQYMDAKWQ